MESYGSIDERSAATPPKFGRRIIAAVAAVALVVGASVAVSVNRLPGANLFMCPMIWAPVCGENGKTYGNACQAQGARMPFTDGECSPDAQAQTIHPTPRPDSPVDLRAGPQGSLREAVQRPHGLHGLVPEVPQRASYDDVLQVLSGVLGPRGPPIGTKADPPPSLCP